MARKRISPIPNVPKDATPQVRKWMENVKEGLDVRLGHRGDPGEAAITFNDLIDAGIVQGLGRLNRSGVPEIGPLPGGGSTDYLPQPSTPVNLTGSGVFSGVHLNWDMPSWRYDVTITEIMINPDEPDLDGASLLGTAAGGSYFHVITEGDEVTNWYWVRHVNSNGTPGPWSSALEVTKPQSAELLLEELSGKITENELSLGVNHRIDLIDAPSTEPGSVNARLTEQRTLLEQTIEEGDQAVTTALSEDITQLSANIGDDLVALEQSFTAEVEAIDGEITTLKGLYTVSINANGLVGGFYLANNGNVVQAGFDVDLFRLGRANANDVYPFIYDSVSGKIVMDTIVVRDGSIESGMIGSLEFGKIVDPTGIPVTTLGGKLKADYIDVGNLQVAEAATFTGIAKSANYIAGQQGWILRPDGVAEFGGGTKMDYKVLTGNKPNEVQRKTSYPNNTGGYTFFLARVVGGGRAFARFRVWDRASGKHNSVEFVLGASYGAQNSATCVITGASRYSSRVITDVRLYTKGTYDDMYCAVRLDGSLSDGNNPVYVEIEDNVQSPGWSLEPSDHVSLSGYDVRTWTIDYNRVADDTRYNTSYDTARVAGTSASTVRDRANNGNSANSRVNSWVRPNTTLINGNKIYTGDAYVDTLQIKGQAVTFTVGSYGGSNKSIGKGWTTLASCYLNSSGAPILVNCSAAVVNGTGGTVDYRVTQNNSTIYQTNGAHMRNNVAFISPNVRWDGSSGGKTFRFQAKGYYTPIQGAGRSIQAMEAKR